MMKKLIIILGLLIIIAGIVYLFLPKKTVTQNRSKRYTEIDNFFEGEASGKKSVAQNKSKRYNVVLIISDALRIDVLGCYGGDAKTPNINWLAAKGALFKNAYSTAPTTLPSSISMFTSNYSMSYGIVLDEIKRKDPRWPYAFYVPNKEPLIGKALKKLGYSLKLHMENQLAMRSNNLQGFQTLQGKDKIDKEDIKKIEKITGIKNASWDKREYLLSRFYGLLHFLLNIQKDNNFFVVIWILDPHLPYNPPEKFLRNISFNPNRLRKEPSWYSSKLGGINPNEMSSHEIEYMKSLYKAEVESVDERVGIILKALKHKKLLNKTYITFTTDHGEFLGENNRFGHGGSFHEELVHIPLIIFGPHIKAGARLDTYVSHIDLMPTIKELLGLKYSDNTQGKSYRSLLLGGSSKDRVLYFDLIDNEAKAAMKNKARALIMNGYKLIVKSKYGIRVYGLYNLRNDPGEMNNLQAKKRRLVNKMHAEIIKRIKENNARREKNILYIAKEGVDLKSLSKETREVLKSLGYIK